MEANNMAAMREALEYLCSISDLDLAELEVLGKRLEDTSTYGGGLVLKLVHGVRNGQKALAAPPRNCDRFADELDAQLAFLNEVWLISIDRETITEQDAYENWTDEMRTKYGRWLLAPATEQKRGAK